MKISNASCLTLKPAKHLAIFFRRSRRCGSFENSCDRIAKPDQLALLAIRSNKRRRSRKQAHLANAGEFNRRYLTCQISAILYPDWRKSQSLHRSHLAIFADRGDRRIKSPSVSPALSLQELTRTKLLYNSQLIYFNSWEGKQLRSQTEEWRIVGESVNHHATRRIGYEF